MVVSLDDRKYFGTGLDSAVYLLKNENHIMKIYSKLMSKLGPDSSLNECLDIIQLYASDTLKAQKIVESRWSKAPEHIRKTNFNGNIYDIKATILPQGEAQIRKEYSPFTSHIDTLVPEDYVVSVGQKYISAPNLLNHFENVYARFSYEFLNERDTTLCSAVDYLNQLITETVEVPFRIVPENVKIIIDEPAKKIDLIVTDLARSIINDYAILV